MSGPDGGLTRVEPDNLVSALEDVANVLRGVNFDTRVPADTRAALLERAHLIDRLTEQWLDQEDAGGTP